MLRRLLLPATSLVAVLSLLAPGVQACDKHLQGHAANSESPVEAPSR